MADLGDSKASYVLTRFEVPLPASRKEKVATFEAILGQGGVQKVVFEVEKPILVSRLVNTDDMVNPPTEVPSDDLWGRVRNSKIEELHFPDQSNSFHLLFYGFHMLSQNHLKPVRIFCRSLDTFWKWLNLPYPELASAFGVDVSVHQDVPEDGVILVGESIDDVVYALRVPLDLPRPKKVFDPTLLEDPPGPPSPPPPPPGRKVG